MSVSYLDNNGLLYFWQKIKNTFALASAVPTKTSQLTNDSGFITSGDIPEGAAASTTVPSMDGTASTGTELAFARGDHRHPSDTSKLSLSGGTMTGSLILSGAPSTTLEAATKGYVDSKLPVASTTDPLMDGSASAGESADYARADHVHPSDTSKLNLSGGTMTGALTLSGAPTSNLHAATKKYVDDLDTAMDTRVDALETAVGTGGSVDTKISNAINALDASISVDSGYAMTGATMENGKLIGRTQVRLETGNIVLSDDVDTIVPEDDNIFVDGATLSLTLARMVHYTQTTGEELNTAIDMKANVDSPDLKGTPTTPTATAGTNNTQIASTAFVTTAVANAIAGVTGIEYQIVTALPATGKAGVIYLISNSGSGTNSYDEYIYVNNAFEKIGTTDVDLSGYVQDSDLVPITNSAIDTIVAS